MDAGPCSEGTPCKMDDSPRYTFDALRKDFCRLKELLRSKSTGKVNDDSCLENQIQTLTTSVESNFEKLGHVFLKGQKCTESRMDQMENLIRQFSKDEEELKKERASRLRAEEELREAKEHQKEEQALKEELCKATMEREEDLRRKQFKMEQQLKELKPLTMEQEKQIGVLKEQLDYSEAKVKCLEEKCQGLELQRRQLVKSLGTRQREQRIAQEIRSLSCEDMRSGERFRVSPSNSCVSLSSCELSDDETVMEFIPTRIGRPDTESLASVDTHDSAFSDSSCAEMLQELNQKVEKLIHLAEKAPNTAKAMPKLPTLIRGVCVNIQESVSSPDGIRLRHFSRSLGVDHHLLEQRIDNGRDEGSIFWAVIHEWYNLCNRDQSRATMLSRITQACSKCGVPNPLEVQPMSTRDRLIIESNYSYLVNHLLVSPALVYLRDSQFLSSSIVRYVTEPESDPEPERIMRFVDILPVFGQRALEHLIDALRKSEQSHIADKIERSDPERFVHDLGLGFIDDRHKGHKTKRTVHCQNIEKQKKKKIFKHFKEKFFKSKSYKLNNE